MLNKLMFAIIIACLNLGLTLNAEGRPPENSNPIKDKIYAGNHSHRKRMPSNMWIEYTYSNGNIMFTLPVECTSLNVSVKKKETGEVWNDIVFSSSQVIEISTLSGEYEIICEDDNGMIYSGILQI